MACRVVGTCLVSAATWMSGQHFAEAMHFEDAPQVLPSDVADQIAEPLHNVMDLHSINESGEKFSIGIDAEGQFIQAAAFDESEDADEVEETGEVDESGAAEDSQELEESDNEIEVMKLHQNLDVRFLPDQGQELAAVVANLSAEGLQARYSLAEIENKNPTPWKKYWNSKVCVQKRKAQKKSNYFLVCHSHAQIIWTPKHKLAYMKIPKAASTAFWYFFKKHFPDSEEVSADKLPKDAYVFTFARNIFEQKLAGFAEVDLKTQAGKEKKLDTYTKFQHVKPSKQNGQARFSAFLDDIWLRHFHEADGRKPGHAGNQIGGALCSHKVDYFGHLEHLTTDWDQIQKEANLPKHLRTKALPVVHADTSETHQRYKYDESVSMTKKLKLRVCEIFRSEFACLGYKAPSFCSKFGLPSS